MQEQMLVQHIPYCTVCLMAANRTNAEQYRGQAINWYLKQIATCWSMIANNLKKKNTALIGFSVVQIYRMRQIFHEKNTQTLQCPNRLLQKSFWAIDCLKIHVSFICLCLFQRHLHPQPYTVLHCATDGVQVSVAILYTSICWESGCGV